MIWFRVIFVLRATLILFALLVVLSPALTAQGVAISAGPGYFGFVGEDYSGVGNGPGATLSLSVATSRGPMLRLGVLRAVLGFDDGEGGNFNTQSVYADGLWPLGAGERSAVYAGVRGAWVKQDFLVLPCVICDPDRVKSSGPGFGGVAVYGNRIYPRLELLIEGHAQYSRIERFKSENRELDDPEVSGTQWGLIAALQYTIR